MSKILEAMRRNAPSSADYSYKLATVESHNLYPTPDETQMVEFEKLANGMLNIHGGQHGQVIVVCSTVKGEGASFVSYNLARHLTYMLGRKICWIDGNFRSPQPRLAGEGPSFRALMADPERFAELKTGANLVVVPHGDEHVKAMDLLSSDNYRTLIDHLQRTFFFTIIDGPPILDSVNVAKLAQPTLGLVVVVEARRLKSEVVQHGIELIQSQNAEVLGTVLNRRTFDLPTYLYDKL